MKFLLIYAITLVAITSCGGKSSGKSKKVINYNSLSSEPIVLTKSTCKSEDEITNPYFTFPVFVQNESTFMTKSFESLLVDREVRSPDYFIVSSSVYDTKIAYNYNILSDGTREFINGEYERFGERVTLCPETSTYQRNSVEAATLSANYAIAKTRTKIQEVDSNLDISSISIEVAPLYKLNLNRTKNGKIETKVQYLTDNAFYSPGDDQITFLPHSKEAKKFGFGDKSFWEIPMVPSHEYGHHVFHSIMTNDTEDDSESVLHASLCFDNRVEPRSKFLNGLTEINEARDADSSEVLGALNEGFADLISFYTLDDNERMLSGVKCLEVSREVGSLKFKDGVIKSFNQVAYDSFFSTTEDRAQGLSTCERTDFQDIHILGAIFATQTDLYLNQLGFSKEQKLKSVLAWLKNLNSLWPELKLEDGKVVLKKSFLLMVQAGMAEKMVTELSSDDCQVILKGFPVEKEYLKAEVKGCL